MKKSIYFIVSLVLLFVSFVAGMWVSTPGARKVAERVQANQAFSHLQAYRELQRDLINDCDDSLALRLDFLIKEQKKTLAEYVQAYDDPDFREYIGLRDKKLIPEVQSMTVTWDDKLELPICNGK